jgi:hypothetical protein
MIKMYLKHYINKIETTEYNCFDNTVCVITMQEMRLQI